MKTTYFLSFIALFGLTLWGCNPAQQVAPDEAALSSARLAGDTTGFHCLNSITKIAVTDLPAAITVTIRTSYGGSLIEYAAKDDAGNFLVAITRNSTRATLLFSPEGTFNQEIEFRGKGGPGGPNGPGRGPEGLIDVATLPAVITNYIKATYAGSTVNVAALDAARGYIVMITLADKTRKALTFNVDGSFAQELTRGVKARYSAVDAATLPAAAKTYITTTYPGSTIKLVGKNPTGQFRVFLQLANAQIIELAFAADGTFVQGRKGRR